MSTFECTNGDRRRRTTLNKRLKSIVAAELICSNHRARSADRRPPFILTDDSDAPRARGATADSRIAITLICAQAAAALLVLLPLCADG